MKYESRLFDEIPFDACQEQEMLHRRSLLHTRQRWYQEFTQRLSCHKKFVDGLIDLDAEQTLAWQMLMCEWEETEARFELEVDDFMVRCVGHTLMCAAAVYTILSTVTLHTVLTSLYPLTNCSSSLLFIISLDHYLVLQFHCATILSTSAPSPTLRTVYADI